MRWPSFKQVTEIKFVNFLEKRVKDIRDPTGKVLEMASALNTENRPSRFRHEAKAWTLTLPWPKYLSIIQIERSPVLEVDGLHCYTASCAQAFQLHNYLHMHVYAYGVFQQELYLIIYLMINWWVFNGKEGNGPMWLRRANEVQCLINWLFNGKSKQKGQFVPLQGEGNWLRQLRMANEIQCILPYVTQ